MNFSIKMITAIITLLTLVMAGFAGEPQGNEKDAGLKWTSLEEAIAKADKQQKPILLDLYTDWCGWCKKLDKETFADPEVAGVLTDLFALAKVNGESTEEIIYKNQKTNGVGLARGFGVRGYPAIIFLDPKGDIITLIPGFLNAKQFHPIVKFIGDREYEKMEWAAYLEKYKAARKGGKTAR